ncbi:hypothetical protein FV139_18685 [Parahaliea maris]|uniref:Ester cyclase n=1 Tax=Parahaliea maris TaxID=2716870 RepID=A0A5C8ZR50_9GAMM|nr:hypothetical protein [Parahaliea maris]TXS90284.1 hypothetical protein FV139_18685 [Parahaliea maris]
MRLMQQAIHRLTANLVTCAVILMVPGSVTAGDHDYSLADSPNKLTALRYIYLANNEGRFAEARKQFYDPAALEEDDKRRRARLKEITLASGVAAPEKASLPPPPSPVFTVKRVVEEGDVVVVLAFVEGVGIGDQITTFMGTPGGTKIGDAVVEIFRFNAQGKILRKWDVIEPLSEATYDFR